MKRFLCVVIALSMIFSCTAAFAMTNNLDFLKSKYDSCSMDIRMSAKLNKPLDILNTEVFKEVNENVDLTKLISSLINSDITMKLDCIMPSYSNLKMAYSMEYNLPVEADNFSANINAKQEIWLQFNAADKIYTTIQKMPIYKKYMKIDLSDETSLTQMQGILNDDTVTQIAGIMIASLEKNAKVKYSKDKVIINLDNNGAKAYITDIVDCVFTLINMNDMEGKDEFNEGFTQFKKAIENVDIIGKDGINIEYTVNSAGYITAEKEKINICTNVYDIMKAFELDEKQIGDITKENSNIDVTFTVDSKITNINKVKEVEFPELTEDNTFDATPVDYTKDYIEKSHNLYAYCEGDDIFYDGEEDWYAVRSVFDMYSGTITAENGVVTITYPAFGELVLTENSNVIWLNGEKITLKKKLPEKNGKLYVNNEVLNKMGYKMIEKNHSNYYSIEFEKPNNVTE